MTAVAWMSRAASSLKTSVVLMLALTALLIAGVVTLKLANVPTSAPFAVILALLFVNLVTVLTVRAAPTLRRLGRATPSATALERWTRLDGAVVVSRADDFSANAAVRVLRGFGYKPSRSGEHALWGVKHRTAPAGFLLFHLSLLVLFAGGVTLWATRFVANVRLTEGQLFDGHYSGVARHAPAGDPAPLRFALSQVDPRFEKGEATDLAARLAFDGGERTSRINAPAKWGTASVLITDVGIAPVVWLQDAAGFTVERLAIACEHSGATRAVIGGREFHLAPHVTKATFPSREALGNVAVDVVVRDQNRIVYRGTLTPGTFARFDGGTISVAEVRYWAALRIVSERGGGLLIAGFIAAVAGLCWRMLAQRREIAVTWNETSIRVAGVDEFFPLRFRDELQAVAQTLGGAA